MNTENLDLRIITAEETPSWLTDFNGNMDKIDTFAGIAKSVDATIQTDLENLHSADNLITTKLDGVTNRVGALETTTTTNTNDISNLKTSVDTIQNDLITQNTAVKQLQTDTSVLKTDVTDLRTDVDNNMGDISAMQADVSTATTKADNAKATADSANSTASSALTTAESAKSTAESANTTSDTALHQAENAQYAADSAETKADNATSLANDAMSRVDSLELVVSGSIQQACGTVTATQGGTRTITWEGAKGVIIISLAQISDAEEEILYLYHPSVFYIDTNGRINGTPKASTYEWTPTINNYEPISTVLEPHLRIRTYDTAGKTIIELKMPEQSYPHKYALGMTLISDKPVA